MIDTLTERIADKWIEITDDPEVRVQKERDWGGFLDFISGLMEILLPLFAMCPAGSSTLKGRSARWAAAVEGGRRGRRQLGWLERVQLRLWQRRFNRELGDDMSAEIDNEELQLAVLTTFAEATEEEITQARADVDRRLGVTQGGGA